MSTIFDKELELIKDIYERVLRLETRGERKGK